MGQASICKNYHNYTEWVNHEGQLHREDGPALEDINGNKTWYVNGKLHRIDGPAIERANGQKEWWVNGKLHREDGPAVEYTSGGKFWYVNGEKHREDGPAIEWGDGGKEWYIHDMQLTYLVQTNKMAEFSRSCENLAKSIQI